MRSFDLKYAMFDLLFCVSWVVMLQFFKTHFCTLADDSSTFDYKGFEMLVILLELITDIIIAFSFFSSALLCTVALLMILCNVIILKSMTQHSPSISLSCKDTPINEDTSELFRWAS